MIEYKVEVYENGSTYWHLNGELHRTDGPAAVNSLGTERWYLNGELHRTDGPAVEYADGDTAWYFNGEPHRTDGPAFVGFCGEEQWYLNGVKMTEEEHRKATNKASCVDKVVVKIDGVKYELKEVEG